MLWKNVSAVCLCLSFLHRWSEWQGLVARDLAASKLNRFPNPLPVIRKWGGRMIDTQMPQQWRNRTLLWMLFVALAVSETFLLIVPPDQISPITKAGGQHPVPNFKLHICLTGHESNLWIGFPSNRILREKWLWLHITTYSSLCYVWLLGCFEYWFCLPPLFLAKLCARTWKDHRKGKGTIL